MQNTEISEGRKKAMLKQMPFYEARFVAPADEKAGEMDARYNRDRMRNSIFRQQRRLK